MESFWQKAKSLAEEATKRSQTLISSTASSSPVRIADIVSETAKRSKDIAAEASKKADEFKTAALLSLSDQIQISSLSINSFSSDDPPAPELELEKFGITQDLRDFVKGLTLSTFQSFPFPDDVASDVATVSNVRQDLSEWQQKHAKLVLTAVKEVSKLRYELCPRHMKDGRFWRIYFTLVSTHVSPYERKFVEESKLKQIAQTDGEKVGQTVGPDVVGEKLKSKTSTSEQDLDSYLLGDLDDSDEHPDDDDGNDAFNEEDDDDDFDKIDNSEIEDEKQ
ncbi:uncharacterized protein [Rutidosis leptorrhynchoides]|uniref:uncharacterized protein isoform X2 n=1 Tax=Rutidosis leptorrhynchoides TaxID=125765 RepID=UPI003A99E806